MSPPEKTVPLREGHQPKPEANRSGRITGIWQEQKGYQPASTHIKPAAVKPPSGGSSFKPPTKK